MQIKESGNKIQTGLMQAFVFLGFLKSCDLPVPPGYTTGDMFEAKKKKTGSERITYFTQCLVIKNPKKNTGKCLSHTAKCLGSSNLLCDPFSWHSYKDNEPLDCKSHLSHRSSFAFAS